jgi:uncharacterized protein (TIGR01319 family)
MKPILFIDFGSTQTKLTAVDVASAQLLGTASSNTTVADDISNGFKNALLQLQQSIGTIDYTHRFACSSAAGGLRMMASGLVPDLTVEAARQAALGAGAKVIGVYSYKLTEGDLQEIDQARPDIFLLTGGTDGGNSENMIHNATMLAQLKTDFPIVIAGNRVASDTCQHILSGREAYVCANVMPCLNQINIDPVQNQVRAIFLKRIIRAKGLSNVRELVDGILMPTPAALLAALKLLAEGCDGESGLGDLMGIDLGGATTDVYSLADGLPTQSNTILKGLAEPYAKRTVEGDIGMRYSVHGIVQSAGIKEVCRLSTLSEERVRGLIDFLAANPAALPNTDELASLDFALASLAVNIAVTRHVGTIEPVYTPMGLSYVQKGKDLRGVRQLVLTGGPLVYCQSAEAIARQVLYNQHQPEYLKPQKLNVLVDRSYILAAMGLLSQSDPRTALKIMKKELLSDGNAE